MRHFLLGMLLLALLGTSTFRQAERLQARPVELKLGPVLSPTIVQLFVPEHATTIAIQTIVKVMFYFGSFFEEDRNILQEGPEYASMYRHLSLAVKLDPYNMDAYYFAQAAFTWEVGRVREVNRMLDYGMQYRTDDYLLPFYAGFNSAYFLKDYAAAARYFQLASDRSGNPLLVKLAARYFHESEQTGLGLAFLETMIKGASDPKTRLIYEKRRDALLTIRGLQEAVVNYRDRFGKTPERIQDLVISDLLPELPIDPYGGTFYLDELGRVRTTSKFAVNGSEFNSDPTQKDQNSTN